jgi:voltage-gated sodium channel
MPSKLTSQSRKLVEDGRLVDVVLAMLALNALCLGVEATPALAGSYAGLISGILVFSQAVFVIEMAVRLCAYAPHPLRFFYKPWNIFDFTVVAFSLLPSIGTLGLVARLLRLLRLVRFVSVSATLRTFVSGRAHGLSALLSTILTLALFGYVMALAGFYLFAPTLAGWSDLAQSVMSVIGFLAPWRPGAASLAHQLLTLPAGAIYLGVLYAGVLVLVTLSVLELRIHRATPAGAQR